MIKIPQSIIDNIEQIEREQGKAEREAKLVAIQLAKKQELEAALLAKKQKFRDFVAETTKGVFNILDMGWDSIFAMLEKDPDLWEALPENYKTILQPMLAKYTVIYNEYLSDAQKLLSPEELQESITREWGETARLDKDVIVVSKIDYQKALADFRARLTNGSEWTPYAYLKKILKSKENDTNNYLSSLDTDTLKRYKDLYQGHEKEVEKILHNIHKKIDEELVPKIQELLAITNGGFRENIDLFKDMHHILSEIFVEAFFKYGSQKNIPIPTHIVFGLITRAVEKTMRKFRKKHKQPISDLVQNQWSDGRLMLGILAEEYGKILLSQVNDVSGYKLILTPVSYSQKEEDILDVAYSIDKVYWLTGPNDEKFLYVFDFKNIFFVKKYDNDTLFFIKPVDNIVEETHFSKSSPARVIDGMEVWKKLNTAIASGLLLAPPNTSKRYAIMQLRLTSHEHFFPENIRKMAREVTYDIFKKQFPSQLEPLSGAQ